MPQTLASFEFAERFVTECDWCELLEDNGRGVYEKAAVIADKLSVDQRVAYLALAKRLRIQREYYASLISIAKKLAPLIQFRKVIVTPIRSPLDEGKIKSGHGLTYTIAHQLRAMLPNKSISPREYVDPNEVLDNKSFVLVDDFVGTGDTFFEMVNAAPFNGVVPDNLIVATIVCQAEGAARIAAFGGQVVAEEIREKAFHLSGYVDAAEAMTAARTYDEIEALLELEPGFRRGYKRSEALVVMQRTPNNTLPVFWFGKGRDATAWPAIFPR